MAVSCSPEVPLYLSKALFSALSEQSSAQDLFTFSRAEDAGRPWDGFSMVRQRELGTNVKKLMSES